MKRKLGSQHIETFRAVVMSGSMTRAADDLHTSQPHVSRLIAQLEQLVGFPLFVRRGTRITTSLEGLRFFEEVEKSYVGLSNLEDAATSIRSFQSDHLRVAAMPRLASGLLTRAVANFKAVHPGTMVSIHSGNASAVHGWIASGFCDIGLTIHYSLPSNGVQSSAIMASECVCVLPVGHRLAGSEKITAMDLTGENFIMFTSGSAIRSQIDGFFEKARVRPHVVAEVDLGASACALVAAGLGVSVINPLAAREEASNEQIIVRKIHPVLPVTLALVCPPHRQKSRLVGVFEDYARQLVAQEVSSLSGRLV